MLAGLHTCTKRHPGEFSTVVSDAPTRPGTTRHRGRMNRPLLTAALVVCALIGVTPAPAPAPASASANADAVGSTRQSTGATWAWPVAAPWHIVMGFHAPATPYSAGHRGIDLSAPAGTRVYAPAAGVVSFAGYVVGRPVLSIVLPGGVIASFEPVEASVTPGAKVWTGEPIGTMASGGHCGTRCLHLGVRVAGEYVSPLVFLASVPPAVLLPLLPLPPPLHPVLRE